MVELRTILWIIVFLRPIKPIKERTSYYRYPEYTITDEERKTKPNKSRMSYALWQLCQLLRVSTHATISSSPKKKTTKTKNSWQDHKNLTKQLRMSRRMNP